MVIIAFYSGMRKNELRSRLISDLHVDTDEVFISVNNKGLRTLNLKLKTITSKRRIEIKIQDENHTNIFHEWYNLRINNYENNKYLFIEKAKKTSFLTKVINESVINELNECIKFVTKRYCSFHSFRHSFITNKIQNILSQKETTDPYEVLDLSLETGHVTPEVLFSTYVHFDLLILLKLLSMYK